MELDAAKAAIRDQFNRCVGHYTQGSPMAERELLHLIVGLAEPRPGDRFLDVACGAGFLVSEFAPLVGSAVGVDLSGAMLAEASQSAAHQGLANVVFRQADAETLPFEDGSFDIVTCKLALHYFPDPVKAIKEMGRVLRPGGRIVLTDRVSPEDAGLRVLHNRLEKLRTPSKVRVYAVSEVLGLLEQCRLDVQQVRYYRQYQDFDEWLATTGAPCESRRQARELALDSAASGRPVLDLRPVSNRLSMTHETAIFVAISGTS